jgi:NADP-dependent 3-hydroxy acid dehydrogenase YdfG
MIDVNLKGLLYLTRVFSPAMVARQSGMIVNVCSTAGKEVYPNGNVYCATKHAVDALTHAMRLDLVKYGIRVGQICPAMVEETEFSVVRYDGDTERAKIYEDFQPLRSPDVAEAIAFMITQPAHVNVLDMVIQGTQQASSTVVDRSGREKYATEEE